MRIAFSKMHGLGNDFMVLDLVTQEFAVTSELIRRWADRRTGVGFAMQIGAIWTVKTTLWGTVIW